MKSFHFSTAVILLAVASFFSSGATASAQDEGGKQYTRCNIWFERNPISTINYKVGTIIPAGTEVSGVQMIEATARFRRVTKQITFTVVDTGASYAIAYDPRYSPGLTIEAEKNRFISDKTLDELTDGFTDKEKECVKAGILKEGISKEAVLVAYGYPPAHKTPTLEMNTWTYWTYRSREKRIYFDQNGQTTRGRVIESDEL